MARKTVYERCGWDARLKKLRRNCLEKALEELRTGQVCVIKGNGYSIRLSRGQSFSNQYQEREYLIRYDDGDIRTMDESTVLWTFS